MVRLGRRALPDRPHPLARSPLADRLDFWLAAAWKRGILPPPDLDPQALWRAAAGRQGDEGDGYERAGRSDADVADFRDRFSRLAQSAATEAALSPLGQAMAWGQLVRAVSARFALGAVWAKRPDLAKTRIAPPIIVVGHMRGGTTRIHKLFAADPAHSATRYCDAAHPVPRRPDLRRLKGTAELAMLKRVNPWLDAIHPMKSAGVEEELGWLGAALNHSIYETQWRIPSYTAFSEAREAGPVYREFGRILRTDAAHRGLADRPRVMKVPVFCENLTELLAAFPDARLVIADRDREAVLKSTLSLVANQMAVQSTRCDTEWIEAEWRRKLILREQRVAEALANWSGAVTRLDFEELDADWEAAIGRAYRELGLDLTVAARAAMRREMAASANGIHRAHARQVARFSAP